MLRAITTQLQLEIAARFGHTAVDTGSGSPREVLWCPPEIALRERSEQNSRLGRPPDENMPFLSFWRIGYRLNLFRLNTPLATSGAHTSDAGTGVYKMVPLDLVYQIEAWSDKEVNFETAIENYYRWASPAGELVLTDTGGVTFQLPLTFLDAQDNSRIQELYDIGRLHRATFPMMVSGYVVTDGGTFKTIETIKYNIYEFHGDPDESLLAKSVSLGGVFAWDTGVEWDSGLRWDQ